MIKIEKNVMDFKINSSEIIGNYKNEMFNVGVSNEIEDFKIESPIEQLLYIALKTLVDINMDFADPLFIDGKLFLDGVNIYPQFKIGKYRVDFKISYYSNHQKKEHQKSIIVECDSQQFHDRTEPERRYEKKRDRDIQKLGYKVFRFTGSEIVKNPFEVAAEILEYFGQDSKQDLLNSIVNFE